MKVLIAARRTEAYLSGIAIAKEIVERDPALRCCLSDRQRPGEKDRIRNKRFQLALINMPV